MANQKTKNSCCAGDSSLKLFIIVVCILAITASVMAVFASFEKTRNLHRQADVIKGNAQANPAASTSPDAGLANPASVNCVNQGGELEIRTDETGGQVGFCIFPDKSECEEWKLFRHDCQMGDSLGTNTVER